MKKKLFLMLVLLGIGATGQVKVGENPTNVHSSAMLQVDSSTKGFLLPRMTNAQMTAIETPATGLILYCTDCNPAAVKVYNGTAWVDVGNSFTLDANCTTAGFVGTYVAGSNTSARSFQVTITNTSFSQAVINFAAGDLQLSSGSGLTVGTPTGTPALSSGNATLSSGASVTVTYPLTGTLAMAGCSTLTGTWNKLALSCVKTQFISNANFTQVASGVTFAGGNITEFTANWIAQSGATGYTLEYSTSQAGPWTAFPSNPYTGTSASITGLSSGLSLYYKVTIIGSSCSGATAIQPLGCFAPTSSGGFLVFMCHNLGADQSANPFTPSWQLNGAYFQWGRKPVDTNGDGYKTKLNDGTEGFAAAPTGSTAGTANDGGVASWSTAFVANGAWNVTEGSPVKTANDPCPSGYRVPTRNEWVSIYSTTPVNTQTNWSNVGTYSSSATNYSAGKNVNNSLYLPASGMRNGGNIGVLLGRGSNGYYWSSTEDVNNSAYYVYYNNTSVSLTFSSTRINAFSVRCVAE